MCQNNDQGAMFLLQKSKADTKKTPKHVHEGPSTRSTTAVWLIGQPLASLDPELSSQLPTNGVVLRRLYYELRTKKLTLSAASNRIADEVLHIWKKANIATRAKPDIVSKIKNIRQKHIEACKHKQDTDCIRS